MMNWDSSVSSSRVNTRPVGLLGEESSTIFVLGVSRLGDSSEITAYLAEEAKTLVNDGKFYGDQGAGHLRIIYGVFADRQKSLDGIDRLCAALAKRAAQLGITE